MQIEEIVIGQEYKVRAPNASGNFLVVEKQQNKLGGWEVIAKSVKQAERPSRCFSPEQILATETKSTVTQSIISKTLEIEQTWSDGTVVCIEEVSYWPNWARRGRKPATAGV